MAAETSNSGLSRLCCCCASGGTKAEPVTLTSAQTITTQPKSNGNGLAKKKSADDGFEEIDLQTIGSSSPTTKAAKPKEEIVAKTASEPAMSTSTSGFGSNNNDLNITDIMVDNMLDEGEHIIEDAVSIQDDVVEEATETEVHDTLERMKREKSKEAIVLEPSPSPPTDSARSIQLPHPLADPNEVKNAEKEDELQEKAQKLQEESNDEREDEEEEEFVDAPAKPVFGEPSSDTSLAESVEVEAAREEAAEAVAVTQERRFELEPEEDEGIASENHNGRGPRARDYSTTDASNSEEEFGNRPSPVPAPVSLTNNKHTPLGARKSQMIPVEVDNGELKLINNWFEGKSRMYADASDEEDDALSSEEDEKRQHVTRLSVSSFGKAEVVSKGVAGDAVTVNLKRPDEHSITDDEFSEKLI